MTTINSPYTHAQFEGDLGKAYELAEQVRLEIAEELSPLDGLLLQTWGDLAGAGSDVLRVRRIGNLGAQVGFTAVGSETGTVAATSLTTGYDSITLAQYGMKREESYMAGGLADEAVPSFDQLLAMTPGSVVKSLRELMCAVGAAFTTDVGGTGTALSIDNWLALVAVFEQSPASYKLGRPQSVLKPRGLTNLRASARSETALAYGGPEAFAAFQGLPDAQRHNDWLGLGIDITVTDDVDDDTVDYLSFAYRPGCIGVAFMDTAALRVTNPTRTLRVPEYGLIVEELLDGANQTTLGFRGTFWCGMAEGNANVWGPRRLIKHGVAS